MQYLQALFRQYQSGVAGFFSVVAADRLGYPVNENTQFEYKGGNELVVFEKELEKAKKPKEAKGTVKAA